MSYKNPTPVVVLLIRSISEGGSMRYLIHERGIEPMLGGLAFLSGYIDKGESAEQAAKRELLEEAGLDTMLWMWKPAFTRISPTNKLLIFMRLDCLTAEADLLAKFVPNREVRSLSFVRPGDTLCFPIHTEVLREL